MLVLVDRFGDGHRLERCPAVHGAFHLAAMHGVGRERRGGETDPELRGAPGGDLPFDRVRLLAVEQLETVVGERKGVDALPARRQRVRVEPDRDAISPRVDRERRHKVGQLRALHAALELDRADVVAMKAERELVEQRMIRVGGDALDHELPARDADRQHRVFGEQAEQGARDGVDCAVEERMAGGIDRVLVHGDRKLDQKVAELAREDRRRSVGRGGAMPAAPAVSCAPRRGSDRHHRRRQHRRGLLG